MSHSPLLLKILDPPPAVIHSLIWVQWDFVSTVRESHVLQRSLWLLNTIFIKLTMTPTVLCYYLFTYLIISFIQSLFIFHVSFFVMIAIDITLLGTYPLHICFLQTLTNNWSHMICYDSLPWKAVQKPKLTINLLCCCYLQHPQSQVWNKVKMILNLLQDPGMGWNPDSSIQRFAVANQFNATLCTNKSVQAFLNYLKKTFQWR